MTKLPEYEVYALKYAKTIRPSRDFFIFQDPHDGPLPMYYYIWVLRGPDGVIVVDTGFDQRRADARKRTLTRCPVEALSVLGIAAADVKTVILTHLHYDHAGNIQKFPNAEFVVQDEEVKFATGRYIRHAAIRMPFEEDDVVDLVRCNFNNRVRFVDGDQELSPGIGLHLIGGHSKGLQAVTVNTRRGTLVLASDAAHFFENMTSGNPFPIVIDVAQYLEGYDTLRRLAPTPDHIIPGHDPLVMDLYPKLENDPLTVILSEDPLKPSPLMDA